MISIVIPAYNERSVIRRTIDAMTHGANPGELEVIVVCNGCTDDTSQVAKDFGPPVRVIETSIGSKTHALNLGDKAAEGFPRIYSDGDVELPIDAIRALARRLEPGDVLAVAPSAAVDLTACSWGVRACYKIRSLLPSSREGIGGSGVYALSEAGRKRFREFPKVTADDGFVRIQFKPTERETLTAVRSKVYPPRSVRELIVTKTRAQYGSFELKKLYPELWENAGESNDHSLLQLFKNPRLWPALLAYCFVTVIAKRRARKRLQAGTFTWQRDESSRVSAE